MILPMDETLALCAVDLSGHPYLNFDVGFTTPRVGDLDTEMVREFFYAVSYAAGMNLHIELLDERTNHHRMKSPLKKFCQSAGCGGTGR